MTEHVVMFSSGAGSAVAAKRVAERYGTDCLTLLFADVNGEHPDNYRFLREASAWVGGELVVLDNGGKTIWDVFEQVRFLGNHRIDPCSRVLKREPMRRWLDEMRDPTETVVHLGFDWTEEHRLVRSGKYWAPWHVEAPLCWEPPVDKAEALQLLTVGGVEPPWLTRMGFPHANCGGGCVKAGMKQFRRLHEVDPAGYAAWERGEERVRRLLGADVAFLTDRSGGRSGADRRPLSLREFRESRLPVSDDEEWGGCSCLTPLEDDAERAGSEDPATQ